MKNNQKSKAFSLIELSIVVLIIGLIVAGVIGGQKLITLSSISKARTLTNSSAVNGIENLVLWLETTSKDSFSTIPTNGVTISTWLDINPQSNVKNNATAGVAPTYIQSAINGLPAIRFDGSTTFLNYSGASMIGTEYTVFVVEQRRSSASSNYFIGGGAGSADNTLILGYRSNTTATQTQFNNDNDVTISGYSGPIPRIHSYIQSSTTGRTYYINGTLAGNVAYNVLIQSYNNAKIGQSYNANFYNGDIGEIIMFTRALSDFERTEIQNYLSKKWAIKLT